MSISSTITELLSNPTPGDILLEEFIKPMGLTQNGLARAINVPPRRINEIVLGKRAVTADTDLRLARVFGLSEGFWLGLQADYELMANGERSAPTCRRSSPIPARLNRSHEPLAFSGKPCANGLEQNGDRRGFQGQDGRLSRH